MTAAVPVEVRSFAVSVYWHRRSDQEARLISVRKQLEACVGPRLVPQPRGR